MKRTRTQVRYPHRGVMACGLAMLPLASMWPVAAVAQTTYQDPKGRFEVEVPDGWNAAPDTQVDMTIIRRGAAEADVVVAPQRTRHPMTAQQFVDANVADLKQQCPTFAERQRGNVTLAGHKAIYALATCSDPKSPAVAETAAVLTPDRDLVGITTISPLRDYRENLPVLDRIRDSLRVGTGSTAKTARKDAEPLAVTEAKRECAVGLFASSEECARQIGIAYSHQTSAEDAASAAAGNQYHDPKGRFAFTIPHGWTATAEGDHGILGVQLRSGTSFINVMPADPAPSASEVVLRYERARVIPQGSERTAPLGAGGLLQVFGHGVELAFDQFSADGADGSPRNAYIGGVGNVAGSGQYHMLLVASIAAQSDDDGGKAFLTVGQSMRLGTP